MMPPLSTQTPFVLLDDARGEGAAPARLYTRPVDIIETDDPAIVPQLLSRLGSKDLPVVGFLSYDAGQVLEPRLASRTSMPSPSSPLLWFASFESCEEIAADAVASLLPSPAGAWIGTPQPRLDQSAYVAKVDRVKAYIEAGDIYQANLTFACDVPLIGDPLAIYAGLRRRAAAGYGGIVWTGKAWLLSLSPELFFVLRGRKLTTRPMKGTATRGADSAQDQIIKDRLQSDAKQRAENLMIVDLLRNDLSRVATPGSVAVPSLFHVETYPTIHQMTSTITAQLADRLGAVDVMEQIFPCGSITGAPKIRAMEIIGEVEAGPRGVYTGAIGRIDPTGDAAFNVAIRTLYLQDGAQSATMGLGSGIVADSEPDDEWRECLAKGGFVASEKTFDLFETMRFDPASGIHLLERHLARMGESARLFGFPFDRHVARNELQAATFRVAEPSRVRLMLSASGRIAIESERLLPVPADFVPVRIVPLPVDSRDFRLRHKTTDRSFYVEARNAAGSFEVALLDPEGFITEGSFTNIFVRGPGALLTPPLSRGLLPGVLRGELIANGSAVEAELRPEDLTEPFFIGNASRGLLPARLVDEG
jgi:para-aminobenzoate synthetase / 4-amino-4-deoxychorismate lyase